MSGIPTYLQRWNSFYVVDHGIPGETRGPGPGEPFSALSALLVLAASLSAALPATGRHPTQWVTTRGQGWRILTVGDSLEAVALGTAASF